MSRRYLPCKCFRPRHRAIGRRRSGRRNSSRLSRRRWRSRQIELTQTQIDAFIATEKEIAPITSKLKGNAQPSKQIMSQMETIAKKNGFKDFDEFGDVGTNIGMVFGGIDPQSKQYNPEELIRREIAAVQGNSKIPAKQKQQILKDLQQASTSVPKLKYPANAELVSEELRSPATADGRPAIVVFQSLIPAEAGVQFRLGSRFRGDERLRPSS